jgi:hypothetical protein
MIQAIAVLIFIAQPAAALAKTVDAVLHETTGFVMGYGGPEMALFLNPNSVRGHSLYEEMVPYMDHYAWRMYIIPVGFTKKREKPRRSGRGWIARRQDGSTSSKPSAYR